MIDGPTIRLRAPAVADLDALTALRNDVEMQLTLLARPRPNSVERVEEWIARLAEDGGSCLFVIERAVPDGAVGFVQLTGIDTVSGHARLGIAVRSADRGRGVGREAIELVWSYGQSVWGLRKLVLEVRADNTAAIALYRRLGFRDVGTLDGHFRIGDRYHDVLIMELVGPVTS